MPTFARSVHRRGGFHAQAQICNRSRTRAEYRRCFLAPEGRTLVIADYSQIELRILADFSGDKNFIDAFVSGQDFHSMTAAQVLALRLRRSPPTQRSFAKRLNFGVVYGIGASRFAMMTGLSQSTPKTRFANILPRYPADGRVAADAVKKCPDRAAPPAPAQAAWPG